MEWPSPWGRGAPGWHLECSVMSMEYLGSHFDIHTGGADHPPVHHTNEIAQSEAYLGDGQPWVNWWAHCEFINLKGAKMSKSTGGGALVQDMVDRGYHPLVYRYLLLQSHYRNQVEFSWEAMDGARVGLRRLLDHFPNRNPNPGPEAGGAGGLDLPNGAAREHFDAFNRAVSDDLNMPVALAAVHAAARDERLTDAERSGLAGLIEPALCLGLGQQGPQDLDIKPASTLAGEDEVAGLVAERDQARSARDFARSDHLRRQLVDLGVLVEDHADGTSAWRWA